jgi:outer membrane immunogenic protein
MKQTMLAWAALSTLALATPAQSALVYKGPPAAAPLFSWTGCYAGGHIGGGFNRETSADAPASVNVIGGNGGSVGTDGAGPLAGAQLGCNYQVSNWILGIEGDADWADLNGISRDPFFGGKNVQTIHQRTDFLADVTGRAGYGRDGWLLYAKGGVAFSHENYGFDYVENGFFAGTTPYDGSQSRTGWVLGGGVEWALWRNWSAKAEYLHYDFGSDNLLAVARGPLCFVCNSSFSTRIGQTEDTFKLGLNYHFIGF